MSLSPEPNMPRWTLPNGVIISIIHDVEGQSLYVAEYQPEQQRWFGFSNVIFYDPQITGKGGPEAYLREYALPHFNEAIVNRYQLNEWPHSTELEAAVLNLCLTVVLTGWVLGLP